MKEKVFLGPFKKSELYGLATVSHWLQGLALFPEAQENWTLK